MSQPSSESQAQFEAMLALMRKSFIAELPERCDLLEQLVIGLEHGQDPTQTYQEMYRHVHSLKGSGGTHGLSIITTICHQFETFMAESRGHYDTVFVSTSLAYVDLLKLAGTLALERQPDYSRIEENLVRLRQTMLHSRHPVLIAESSSLMCSLYQKALSTQPLQLSVCNNGLAALDQLVHQNFELLIIARELDVLSGAAVVAALRESHSHNRGIPVLMVSSNDRPVASQLHIHQLLLRNHDLAGNLARLVAGMKLGA